MYEIAGGVDDAGGGGLTALLGCPSEGSGVFVLLRLGICVGIVNDGARVAGWYTRVSVRENVERVRRDMQRERQGRLSTERASGGVRGGRKQEAASSVTSRCVRGTSSILRHVPHWIATPPD